MATIKNGTADEFLNLFEEYLSAADILSAKLTAQVSAAITKERLKLHMTQTEFADYINVAQSQISRWERGDYNFTVRKIAEVAAKLNLDVNIHMVDMELSKPIDLCSEDNIMVYKPAQAVYKLQTSKTYSEKGGARYAAVC